MRKNMGTADRVIRIGIAIIIAVLFFTEVITGSLGIILMVVLNFDPFQLGCFLPLVLHVRSSHLQE